MCHKDLSHTHTHTHIVHTGKNDLYAPVYPWALKAEREVYFCWLLGGKSRLVHPIKALHAICPPCWGVKCHEFLMLNEPINPWVKVLCSASANWPQWLLSRARLDPEKRGKEREKYKQAGASVLGRGSEMRGSVRLSGLKRLFFVWMTQIHEHISRPLYCSYKLANHGTYLGDVVVLSLIREFFLSYSTYTEFWNST